jgi:hypothetical protein
MHLDFEDLIPYAIGVFIIGLLGLLVVVVINESRKWEDFKITHNCKIVAHIKGDVFNTFGTDSKGGMTIGVGSTPDKKGWLCDDGITYYH